VAFLALLNVLMIYSFFIYAWGGRIATIDFAVPATVLLIINIKTTNFIKMFIVTSLFTIAGEIWDITEHSAISPAWVYINSMGQHSDLWINARWSWIMGKMPSEIIWFMWTGSICVYQIFETLQKLYFRKITFAALAESDKFNGRITR
jgi:hypothetical protein